MYHERSQCGGARRKSSNIWVGDGLDLAAPYVSNANSEESWMLKLDQLYEYF